MNAGCTEILRVQVCDPVGPLRESLASFIIRTARENDTSPGILLERKYSSGALDGLRCNSRALGLSIGQSINGCSPFAGAFVQRSEELTKLSNLRASTALAFAPFTTINGLQRRRLAWGAEFLRGREIKHYPLLWALDPVKVCLVSRKPLISLCPQCREPLAVLSGGSWVGRCHYCGTGLDTGRARQPAAADPVASAIKNLDYEIWVAEQLGEFIRFQITHALPGDFNYTRTVMFWFGKFGIKNTKIAAKEIGASQQAVTNWLGNQTIPRLRMTLNLCWVLGLSLLQFLKMEMPVKHNGRLRASIDAGARHISPSRRRRINKPALASELTRILRSNDFATLSFTEICRKKIGRSDIVVREAFPDQARAISKRYLESRSLLAEVRKDQYCAAICRYSKFLHARGITPNHKTLSQYVDHPSLLRCAWAISALRAVRLELGYEDESEQLLLAI